MLLSASSVRECVMQSSAGQIRNEFFFFLKRVTVSYQYANIYFYLIIYFTVNSVNIAPLYIAADDSVGRSI